MQLQWKQSHDFYRKRSCQGQENVSKHPLQHLCLFLNAYMFSLGNEGANENTSDGGNPNQLLTVAHRPKHRRKHQLETNYLLGQKPTVS